MHKFQVKQIVRVLPAFGPGAPPAGLYEIVRLMPAGGGSVSYRVKGMHESHERVVDERCLSADLGNAAAARQARGRQALNARF